MRLLLDIKSAKHAHMKEGGRGGGQRGSLRDVRKSEPIGSRRLTVLTAEQSTHVSRFSANHVPLVAQCAYKQGKQ